MALDFELHTLREEFKSIIESGDKEKVRTFLDDQNISDVAELIDEFSDYETTIIANMSIHRAASVFKILDFPAQKRIIQTLPPSITASLLNELPADDRTCFHGGIAQ